MSKSELAKLRNDMEKCFRCSLCKMVPLPVALDPDYTDACPAARHFHFHGYSGSGKQIMALSLLDGRIKPDRALARIAFACTACGYCDVACKFIMDAERHIVNMKLREHLVDSGMAPLELAAMIERLVATGRPAKEEQLKQSDWTQGLGLKKLPEEKAEVMIYAGCGAAADEPTARTARRLALLLRSAGIEAGYLTEEPCCGLPAYWAGYRRAFVGLAADATAAIEKSGAKTVVAVSGSCLGSFRSKYPAYSRAVGVEVVHATEFVAGLVKKGKIKLERKINATATYHDPCYLGRQSEPFKPWNGTEKITLGVMTYTDPPKPVNRGTNGVYEPPRELIRAVPGLRFKEMRRIREYSYCCGAGGGAPLTNPEMSAAAAKHRIDEAKDVGADLLITACSHCSGQFRKHGDMQVKDVMDVLFEASGLQEK